MLGIILMTAVNAVAPIIGLIALGYLLHRVGFLDDDFLSTGNRMVFNVCLPVMLFLNIYDISSIDQLRWDIVAYCLVIITILFGLGWLACLLTTQNPKQRGVIWQCFFRSNFAIIGLPLAQSLGGDAGAAMAAVLSAFCIPAFNIYGVVALTAYSDKKKTFASVIKSVFVNPLTIGVSAGIVALLIRAAQQSIWGSVVFSLERDTAFLYKIGNNLKAIASPLALIVLGGQCKFSVVKGMLKEISVSVFARVVLAPLVALAGLVLLGHVIPYGNGEIAALIALFGSPVAVTSAIMAANMNNDGQLATQLVVWTSVLSVATIFLTVCILMGAGILVV